MRNHYHLVVETPDANLVAGMQWLQSTYTIRLNNRHPLAGHVLSGRYKAQLIEGGGNGYLRTACDYMHLNPIRAKLLEAEDRLLAYSWSSFPLYLAAQKHRPAWLRVDRLLGEHGIEQDTPLSRQEFERHMERRRLEEMAPEERKLTGRILKLGGVAIKPVLVALGLRLDVLRPSVKRGYAALGGRFVCPIESGCAKEVRFSAKHQDDETDLLYYGYRYFNAGTGRWLSRDPIGEAGFATRRKARTNPAALSSRFRKDLASYVVVRNDCIDRWDYLGLLAGGNPLQCPESDGDMPLTGAAFTGNSIGCAYGKCGNPNSFVERRLIRDIGAPTEQWIWYPDPGSCFCNRTQSHLYELIQIVQCSGCVTKTVFYSDEEYFLRTSYRRSPENGLECCAGGFK